MVENPYYKRPAKVLLMGDRVDDESFMETLDRVLSKQKTEAPRILGQDPVYVAAKGVAELAKRFPYDPYKS